MITRLLVLGFLLALARAEGEREVKPETRLREELFSEYEREMVPRKDREAFVNISTFIYIKRVEPHRNFRVSVIGTFIFRWTDENLSYADRNPQKIRSLRVMTDEIWVPDLTVYNVAETPKLLNHQAVCMLYPSGVVTCKRRFSLEPYCLMDYARWPHDTQSCSVYVGSWIESRTHLTSSGRGPITRNMAVMDTSKKNPRWIFKNITVEPPDYDSNKPTNYIQLKLTMQRKDEGHYYTYITPAIVISTFSLVPYWLPRESGLTRVAVTLIAMILNALFIQDLGFSILGWSGLTIPNIVKFYIDQMSMNLFGVILTATLRFLSKREGAPSNFLAVPAAALLKSTGCRLVLGVKAKATLWSVLAALIDRAAFVCALVLNCWAISILVPSDKFDDPVNLS